MELSDVTSEGVGERFQRDKVPPKDGVERWEVRMLA
jgi:hypothetical protein